MSHEVDTMAFVGQLPWWGIGENLKPGDVISDRYPGLTNSASAQGRFLGESGTKVYGPEMLRAAGLDWSVDLEPIQTESGLIVPDRYAVVRQDTQVAFDVVGTKYVPVQNSELFAIPDLLVDEGQVSYETAGSLLEGRTVWALARFGTADVTRLNGARDMLHQYMLWFAKHDGNCSVVGGLTTVRVVCKNTCDAAAGTNGKNLGSRVRVRHTKSAAERIAEAHRVLLEVREGSQEAFQEAQNLAKRAMNGPDFRAFAHSWLDAERGELAKADAEDTKAAARMAAAMEKREERVTELEELFRKGKGNSGESLWDAYNAVTEWLDHKRETYHDEAKRQQHMQNTVLGGVAMKSKGRALALLKK